MTGFAEVMDVSAASFNRAALPQDPTLTALLADGGVPVAFDSCPLPATLLSM
eukprot:CAMPEP_0178443182 /NCGR_PEP_ID=MMETSP0689_2-20121128/38709_1 /TAXON_ID=160604 /ORGANISM="Amphidinium massartii, Strain CS-259" /LENGTH=51 /DNA_ID=CAMNT_0020067073 /DNA_START=181 /DNA_END=337 /DNA_ORIENTATION=+